MTVTGTVTSGRSIAGEKIHLSQREVPSFVCIDAWIASIALREIQSRITVLPTFENVLDGHRTHPYYGA